MRARNPELLFKDLDVNQRDYIGEVDEIEIIRNRKMASVRAKS